MTVIENPPPPLSIHERMVLYVGARLLDFHLWTLGMAAIWLGIMGAGAFERDALLIALLAIVPLLAVMMVFDALVHRRWGTTPGHRLLGISLTTKKGEPLTLSAHLRRNGAIWFRALACFLPPFFSIALLVCYFRMRRGKPWRYDQRHGYRVIIRPVPPKQMARFCLSLLATSLLLAGLAAMIIRTLLRHYVI